MKTLILVTVTLAAMSLGSGSVMAQDKPAQRESAQSILPNTQMPIISGGSMRNSPINPSVIATGYRCNEIITHGETLLKAGNINGAILAYQSALAIEPQDGLADQRLAEAYTAAGRLDEAMATYRTLLYFWPGKGWGNSQGGDPAVLMRFALVLLQTGRNMEALTAYQQGYHFLPKDAGPLPPLFTSPDFAPSQFTAAIYTALGITEHTGGAQNQTLASDYFHQSLNLQPDLAQPYFYLGKISKWEPGHALESVDAFTTAVRLGGSEMKPFVDKELKDETSEFEAVTKKAAQK